MSVVHDSAAPVAHSVTALDNLRRRVFLAPTPRERWYAILLLAQGLTAAATADALERDPHTIGHWTLGVGLR